MPKRRHYQIVEFDRKNIVTALCPDMLILILRHACRPTMAPWDTDLRLSTFAFSVSTLAAILATCRYLCRAITHQFWYNVLDSHVTTLPLHARRFLKVTVRDEKRIDNIHSKIQRGRLYGKQPPAYSAPWSGILGNSLTSTLCMGQRLIAIEHNIDITKWRSQQIYRLTRDQLQYLPYHTKSWQPHGQHISHQIKLFKWHQIVELSYCKHYFFPGTANVVPPRTPKQKTKALQKLCTILKIPSNAPRNTAVQHLLYYLMVYG